MLSEAKLFGRLMNSTLQLVVFGQPPRTISQLKADRPHPRDYPHMPTDYRHTHKHFRLVMTLIALYCTRQSLAPNIDRCVPKIQPWPLTLTRDLDPDLWPWPLTLKQGNSDIKTRFLVFDLDLWPTTLTFELDLAKVKVNLHTKYQGRRSNGSGVRAFTDGRTDATKYIISLASRSIITNLAINLKRAISR